MNRSITNDETARVLVTSRRKFMARTWAAVAAGATAASLGRLRPAQAHACETTAQVPIEGPYFLGDPEERYETGNEIAVFGEVKDAQTCLPIPGAKVVRWHANKLGVYEDYYRALMKSDDQGVYRMQTLIPGDYAGLDRHIHFRVEADGYVPLVTQLQWQANVPQENPFHFALNKIG